MAHFDGAERALLELQKQPQGELRVTATVAMGRHFLSKLVAEFLTEYPDIAINLHLTDREVDLVSENYDVAIRTGRLGDSSLVAKLIGKSSYRIVASPAYLKKHGIPDSPDALREHSCLRFRLSSGATWSEWAFKTGSKNQDIPVKGRFIADDFYALREAAMMGVGIARIPFHLVKDEVESRSLISLLDRHTPAATPIHLIHSGGRHLPTSIRAFIDFIHPRLAKAFRST